eukprot:83284-Pleurochrysis_carterae.AAC.4
MAQVDRRDGYFLSSDVGLHVKLCVQALHGSAPGMWAADPPLSHAEWLSQRAKIAAQDLTLVAQVSASAAAHMP